MRKGALATVDVRRPLRAGDGMLRWLIPPKALWGSDVDQVPVPLRTAPDDGIRGSRM